MRTPELAAVTTGAGKSAYTMDANAPVLLFQAQNDHDLAPNQALRVELQRAGKLVEQRVYPAFGNSAQQGHAFAYQGSDIWFADVLDFVQRHCP